MLPPTAGPGETPLHWVGSAKKDFLAFPAPVIGDMGLCSGAGPVRRQASVGQAVEGQGPGLVEQHDGDTYRCVYVGAFRAKAAREDHAARRA